MFRSAAKPSATGKTFAPGRRSVAALEARLRDSERLRELVDQIHAAEDLDQILVGFTQEILGLFDAERLTIYAVDYARRELVSKFLDPIARDQLEEIRVPIDGNSIAGFVAQNRVILRIGDVYDANELEAISPTLQFDQSWDERTGYRTRQMLTIPVLSQQNVLVGVLQLVNLREKEGFDKEDEEKLQELAKSVGIALYNRYQWTAAQPTSKRRTRYDLLAREGRIGRIELDALITQTGDHGPAIEEALVEKHGVSRRDLLRSLGEYHDTPIFEYRDGVNVDSELLRDINPNYLKANLWVPLSKTDDTVEVVIDDPHNFQKLQDIRRVFAGKRIECRVALREDVARLIERIAGGGPGAEPGSVDQILGELREEETVEETVEDTGGAVDETSGPIVRLANRIIFDAVQAGASDIHIEPNSLRQDTVVRIRVDGVCRELLRVPPHWRRPLSSRFKIMARLDIAERRRPQDGKIRTRVGDNEVELRVVTIPSAGVDNEDVVLRILASGKPMPLESLGMTDRNIREFQQLVTKPYGILLCVGPTGSGKTTTLHAALGYINTMERKIWTAEDPVEISQNGLRQVQVQPKIGFTFAAAMRSFLRADPDVIMVGEMRDEETAETAIEASLTGHLVLSTLHTNTAAETITRLLEMGMDPFTFSDSLLGVLGQRLVRTLCSACKNPYHPPEAEAAALSKGYGEEAFAKLGIRYDDGFRLWRGEGCETCGGTGYKGRAGIHELLVASDVIKQLVRSRASVEEIHRTAMAEGMTTLLQDGILKILSGVTDSKQVWAVAMR